MLQEEVLTAWLTLSFVPRLGPKRLARLLSIDSPDNLLRYSAAQWLAIGLKPDQVHFITQHAPRQVEACLAWQSAASNRHIITPLHSDYPALLKPISAAPSVLFVEGHRQSLAHPQLAMVGSRNASIDGQKAAYQFAKELSEHRITVTSGLALGIDGHAHDGALAGGGNTIAVLGSGLAQIYPARHRRLAARIVESGALVSEFAPHTPPKAAHFPRRNRIISGLSLGVLVVEAAIKSGSLITARYATEQDRDVFVLPGSIYQANHGGSNDLIRQGASLVQTVPQILEELNTFVNWSLNEQETRQPGLFSSPESEEQLPFPELLANVGEEATPVDILASRTNIPVHEVMTQLLELELSGHVVAVSGGYIRKGRG